MLVQDYEIRARIPATILEFFRGEPRILIKWRPDGIYPIDVKVLIETDLLQKIAADPDFQENYELVVMKTSGR
jgi:hypothetical protein